MSKPNSIQRRFPAFVQALLGLLISLNLLGKATAQILPPMGELDTNRLAAGPRLFVRAFQFEGNRAFTDAALAQVTSSFTNREISTGDLEQARRAVTVHYVSHGYINSGAVIPDQNPVNGIVRLKITEGRLTDVHVQGNKWLNDRYLEGRVRRWSSEPLNMNQLREGLQILRQNPNITQINAELKPGAIAGESELDLRVTDRHPFRAGLQLDNQRPPSVGSEELWALASDLNLTGHSDPLELRYGIAQRGDDTVEFSEFDNWEARYRVSLTPYDTTIGLRASRLNTSLVEDTFAALRISSLTTSYGIDLRQPIFQTANQELALTLGFDYRRNKTHGLGSAIALSPGADDHGEMNVSSLRFSQEWLQRGQEHVLSLRSTFNFGIDIFDSTDNGIRGDPDGTYFSWLGQGQYVQRLFHTQNQLVLRLTGQWSDERLLALEQLSVGGLETVRGYFENQLVRDRGIIASAEVRLPILFNKAGAGIVSVAPFVDYGRAWNVGDSSGVTTIPSVGSGLLVSPNKHISAQVYWGYRFRDVPRPEDSGAQGAGISFRINLELF